MRASPATARVLVLGVSLLLAGARSAPAEECVLNERQKLTAWDAVVGDEFGYAVSIYGNRIVVGAPTESYERGSAYVFRLDDGGTPLDPHDDAWVQEAKLTTLDPNALWLGHTVSMTDDRVILGAPLDGHAGVNSGAAYVFRRDDNGTPADPDDDSWVQEAKLTGADTASWDKFGSSVSIAGHRILVGARWDDDGWANSGSAYVFRYGDGGTPLDPSDDSWVQEAKLTATDAAFRDYFGGAVAINGTWAIVGAMNDDDACPDDTYCDSGAAYMFRLDDAGTPLDPGDDIWVHEGKLTAVDAAGGDWFGSCVALSADWAAIAAMGKSYTCPLEPHCRAGSVYLFRRDESGTPADPSDDTWTQETKLTPLDLEAADLFGSSVSIAGDWIVAGASLDTDSDSGSAYLFRYDDSGTPSDPTDDVWLEQAKLAASDAAPVDQLGGAVSISGNVVIVGARYHDDVEYHSGSAYMYTVNDECTACPAPEQGICFLPPEGGPCDGICPRYFYNAHSGQCETFFWGCCGGNANKFATRETCEAACPIHADDCYLPADPGPCDNACPRFFFNAGTGQCEPFVYGGCGGNVNNFVTVAQCEAACPRGTEGMIPTVSEWGLVMTALLLLTAGTLVHLRRQEAHA